MIEIIPPSQANQQPSCYIFHKPKINSSKANYDDEGENIRECVSDDKIAKWADGIPDKGSCFEDEGEDAENRMCSIG